MTTNIPTVSCAGCRKDLPITERVWFLNLKVYCLECGALERKANA